MRSEHAQTPRKTPVAARGEFRRAGTPERVRTSPGPSGDPGL